ncbi:hypothetical protein C8R44DRAFT_894950 [Mycena epipterygia]|nr:hypothetical protein C8R44DRAFT_894950 [Mycena epipterygia]
MACEHEREDTDMDAPRSSREISAREAPATLVLALASDAVSRRGREINEYEPPQHTAVPYDSVRAPGTVSLLAVDRTALRRHARPTRASIRTAACAFSPRRTTLCPFRATYDPAHAALRASYVARVRSRRHRSFTPSTFTPRLATRDGAQSHSDVDTPLPVAHKRPPVLHAHVRQRVAARPHRAPPCTATGAQSLHPYARDKYHVRGPILDAENTGPISPRTQRASRCTSPPARTLSPRDHTPHRRSRRRTCSCIAHDGSPPWIVHTSTPPGMPPPCVHESPRQYRSPPSSRRGRPHDSPPNDTHNLRTPHISAPQLASLYLCARHLPARIIRAAAAFSPAYDSPFHNLPLAFLSDPHTRTPRFRAKTRIAISLRTIRAPRTTGHESRST